jgi:hypothetical protein
MIPSYSVVLLHAQAISQAELEYHFAVMHTFLMRAGCKPLYQHFPMNLRKVERGLTPNTLLLAPFHSVASEIMTSRYYCENEAEAYMYDFTIEFRLSNSESFVFKPCGITAQSIWADKVSY